MKIAIVILNWNGKKLLEQFLPSVITHSQEADIYVADNASDDDSIEFITTNFPSISIIKNLENGGFAKGYNDALNHITADIYCLLNNDVDVTPNWLKPILKTFKDNSNVSVIQPKILDYNQKNTFEYAGAGGGFIDKYGYPYCRGRIFNTLETDIGQYNDTTNIFWASGACLFIKATLFKSLNGFDESFFAHMEEIDLCWRAKNLGHEIKYVGTSTIYHLGGGTLSNSNPKKTFLNFRNSLFTIVKNAKGNWLTIVLIRLMLDGIAGIKFFAEFKFKHSFAIINAHISFYRQLNKLLKFRKTHPRRLEYFDNKSIVWAYFIRNKRTFDSL